MKMKMFGLIGLAMMSVACTRIETGEVGVRVGFDKQVEPVEIQPGSFPQVMFGDVLHFQVKDVQVDIENLTPLASDNSTIADFDMAVVYSLNATQVAELYIDKNKGFHLYTDDGVYLMYNYVYQIARNAAYKSARKYESLKMSDSRAAIEQEIREVMIHSLADEGLDGSITIQQILIRQILPAPEIIESANQLVKSQNQLKQKEVEVMTARKEAERINVLNENKGAIEYMNAMSTMTIAEAVRDGKVNTIIIPVDFKGIVDTRQK